MQAFGEIADGKEVLLHYIVSPKPWQMPPGEATRPFYDCLDRTAFAGWRPRQGWTQIRQRLAYWKYRYARWREAASGGRAKAKGGYR
jgi:hypothetical protein